MSNRKDEEAGMAWRAGARIEACCELKEAGYNWHRLEGREVVEVGDER
jgi:hypothetical protein